MNWLTWACFDLFLLASAGALVVIAVALYRSTLPIEYKKPKDQGEGWRDEASPTLTKALDTVYAPKPSVTIVDADDPATIVKMEALERERKQHRGPKPDER